MKNLSKLIISIFISSILNLVSTGFHYGSYAGLALLLSQATSHQYVNAEEFDEYQEEFEEYDEEGLYEEDLESDLAFIERSFRAQSNAIFDLLDEERDKQIKAEDFMYPFEAARSPMLSQNLVDTIQGVSSSFTNTRKVNKSKGRALKSRGSITKLGKQPAGFGDLKAATSKKGKAGKDSKAVKVKVPDFDISGTFGTKTDAYVVIGQRYYTVGDRLKGSRDLRRVVVLGIDDQFAYFNYQNHKFVKKIKALESVF